MKSVRDELTEALRRTLHSCCMDDRGPPPCASCRITTELLSRHAAEPDDRPRLLEVLKATREMMHRSDGSAVYRRGHKWRGIDAALAACSDIETP